ncbi:MAG: hypothetical protein B7X95_04150 [Methylophilaceae bacterium 17-44-8]|jgi:ElaB/YqjD/DUF883 family membrane-anchored ribosome-binding protein|nr:MAG: hypothetical protein B7Y48_08090 [Methylophilales bacterium 28-44-11]OZA06096.1 MAG: hypothetical protein B7X95_04150 [Methylophilaceae bacterium 17-44-8]
MNTIFDATAKSHLMDDFNMVVADVDALLKATANQGGDKLIEVRNKVEESLKAARASMIEAETALLIKTKAAAQATDVYVHENPWQSVGVAAGVGFIVGWLSARR